MIRVVFAKELVDSVRDKRSVLSAFIFPLVGPIALGLTLWIVAEWQRADRPLELAIVGAEHALSLVTWLDRNGVTILEAPRDPEAEVRDGKVAAVLVIPESYSEDFRAGRPIDLRLLVDESRNKTRMQTHRAQRLLAEYSAEIGSLRLLSRGMSPEVASPLRVKRVDLATPERLAASLLNMLPLFLLMAVFIGGMNIAIDATAGERERGSLEPLLINPVSRARLMGGKWGATTVFSAVVLLLMVAVTALMTSIVSFEGLGVDLSLGARDALLMLALTLPLAPLATALQLLLATFARSFKEAQTYLSLLLFVPMAPGIVLGLHPVQSEAWMMVIPGFAQIPDLLTYP